MRLATFNVNSVKARLPRLLEWLDDARPDILLLQEIKCQTADFPTSEFTQRGYDVAAYGQKSYNGVAIISQHPIEACMRGLPGMESDPQARYIEATIAGLRVVCLYLPNGNPVWQENGELSEKFHYKLRWMAALYQHVKNHLRPKEMPLILGGDFNLIPEEIDAYDSEKFKEDALYRLESRKIFRSLLYLGLNDAFRVANPMAAHVYSYWDYVKGRWQKDEGVRIDHFLLCPQSTDRLINCHIDKSPRGKEKASDHTPVIVEIAS